MRQEKEIKDMQIRKEEVNLSLFADDIILFVETLKTPRRWEGRGTQHFRTNKFNKAAGYKTNSQKSVAFLFINNDLLRKEIKKTIPFMIASKRIKYLRINLTKEVEYLYTENYKTVMKETEDTNKWKDILCSRIGRMSILPK